MGIPSYFSYIVKNHRNIIKKLKTDFRVDNLYLDSNSIIYDCLRKISKEYNGNNILFEAKLIEEVCLKIDEYVHITNPQKKVMITFDGVAPVAKLEQQRNRRYKSQLEIEIFKNCGISEDKKNWNKTAITPGTQFMKNLNKEIKNYFNNKSLYIISGSDIPGEGEHKIFEYIRKNSIKHKNETTLIYGLDADLIMLCLNHLNVSNNIYLYRETPEFIKSIDSSLDPNSSYILNINLLSEHIINEMGGEKEKNKTHYIHDYILLCFFLGNDFLPHFPALNIRTKGIHILLNSYKHIMKNKFLTNGNEIIWKNLRELVIYLSENELSYIKQEYKSRDRYDRMEFMSSTPKEKTEKYLNIPIKNRDTEKYIDPYKYNWENRYYEKLFDIDITNEWRKKISLNYMEGLEWTMKYYTSGCKDWRWLYKYNYPPLLVDLVKYIPSWNTTMIEDKGMNPVTENLQLAYVLPPQYHDLLQKKYRDKICNLSQFKISNYNVEWSFCRYFWESHLQLPHIDIEELEGILTS